VEVPQTLENKGGQLNVAPVLEMENFTRLEKEVHVPHPCPDNEEDTRSSHEYLNNLDEEYQERALLAKSKRFFKKGTQRFNSVKATDQTECYKCGKKEWDEEEVSSDDNEMVEVKVLLVLAEENDATSKEGAINAGGFILPNHDTGRILPIESQRNTTDPLVAVTDSSTTDYDSANES
nr:retrovirus-related Pol polyprotein from transposon TNT 1-94 [Tanacetum cinerariifolium]